MTREQQTDNATNPRLVTHYDDILALWPVDRTQDMAGICQWTKFLNNLWFVTERFGSLDGSVCRAADHTKITFDICMEPAGSGLSLLLSTCCQFAF